MKFIAICVVHARMNFARPVFLLAIGVVTFGFTHAAESPPKKSESPVPARAEDRMKDEKRRDEQAARGHAANVKVARFDSTWRPPRTEDIDVYQPGEAVPHGGRKNIALMSFECEIQDETHAVAGFIVKAKDLGADGVVLLPVETVASGQILANLPSPRDRRVFRANAVAYK
jgi:hypothetical protein